MNEKKTAKSILYKIFVRNIEIKIMAFVIAFLVTIIINMK